MGCLLVDVRHDISKTFVKKIDDVSVEELTSQFNELRIEAKELLVEEGISDESSTLMNYMDLRYKGQWRSLAVIVPDHLTSLADVLAAFHKEHEREFAFSIRNKSLKFMVYV